MRRTALAKQRIAALETALRREHYTLEPQPYPILAGIAEREKHVKTCSTCLLLAEEP